jgi:periplasmic copper chaperone A
LSKADTAFPPLSMKEKIMARFHSIVVAAIVSLAALPALAQEFKAGDIIIDKAWSRATPKGAAVGVGYFVIHNHGATPDRLIGGAADFAGGVSVHEMRADNGIMRMRELAGGLEIPAHGEVVLSPGGYHIMFTGLKQPLNKGESVKASLAFEHAGAIAVEFAVGGVGAAGPGGAPKADDSMKGMKM